MIAALKGKLFKKNLNNVLVDVNGVIYEINAVSYTHLTLPTIA
jgi:Holliday junction resolvasome RuvABC DNA-binding subunit